jgi:N-acetylgalactosamine-N,N'-diacetylbacillosaminyl-diphospho-undecaprenol 4-alpha-N-acetylgalactosaminyltransferase
LQYKIVIFINSLEGGGAERVVTTLLNSFADKYECYLILMENKISYDLDSRIKIINLNEESNQNGFIKLLRLPIIAYKLGKIVKEYKFSKVISFLHRANYVNVLAKRFGYHKAIISERIASSSLYHDDSITSKISKFLIKYLYNKADLIISVSKAIVNDLKYNFEIKVEQKVIYNPYDIDKIEKLSNEAIEIQIDKEKSIIAVGSLQKRKNYSLLLESFSKLKDEEFKLYILGKGEEEFYLKSLASTLNISDRVVFLGFDNNPYKYLSKCGIFVLTSNSEGFPNVLIEAMICGCRVISTDCLSGPREILSPLSNVEFQLKNTIEVTEYGILTPIEQKKQLEEAILLMINDNELRENYTKKIKERVENFRQNKILNEFENILGMSN